MKLQCLDLYKSPQVSIVQLTKVLGISRQKSRLSFQNKRTVVSSGRANSSLERKEALSGKYNFKQHLKTGVSMVDNKFGDFQWDFSSQISILSCAPDGCAWLERSPPGKINGMNTVISREKIAYQ